MPTTPAPLNTRQAAAEINRLLAAAGSPRQVAYRTLVDWRLDGRGPRYRRVSGWFVEYDVDVLRDWVENRYRVTVPTEPVGVPA